MAVSVAYVLTSYPPAVGGVQLHAHALLRHLAGGQGQWVVSQWDLNRTDWLLGSTVFSPWRPRDYCIDGVEVRRLRFGLGERLLMLPAVPFFYFAPVVFSPYLARFFRRALRAHLVGVDLVHAFRIGRENLVLAALEEARARGVPFVFTPTHHPRWVGWRYRVFHRVYREADRVIALTGSEREALVRLGVKPERVRVTGIGPVLADQADPVAFRQHLNLDSHPVVLFLGQKYRYKGIDLLLEAAPLVWRRQPNVRFLFVGPRTRFSRRLFSGRRDARLVELGAVSLEEKTSALAAADLLVLPSRQESFGGVLTEAWSLGKPVIAGRIPATSEIVADGEDGFLTPFEPAALAERISVLLEDPALARRMGQAGREKVRRRFDWPIIAERTRAVYREVLGG